MNIEIERKFLIKKLPDNLEEFEHHVIEQGYLCREPVVRVRKSDDDYYMTYKGKGLKERIEYNLPLNQEAYNNLVKKCDGTIIKKTRYVIPYGDLKIELDIFENPANLVMAEVEFASAGEADEFTPPDWFSEDVTYDKRYHNSNM